MKRRMLAAMAAGAMGITLSLAVVPSVAGATARGPHQARIADNVGKKKIKKFSQTFEENTKGWCNLVASPPNAPCDGAPGDYGTIARVRGGSSAAPYGTGIAPAGGSWYASVDGTGDGATGCPTYPAEDESCTGPYTSYGNPNGNYDTFPSNGFTTSLDIYLDTSWAASNPGNEFEWDTALNTSTGGFLEDFIFTAETQNSPNGFVIGIGANTTNDPGSGSGSLGNYTPATVTTSGWYEFIHHFYKYNLSGDLGVEMEIVNATTHAVVADWTADTGYKTSQAGGPLYGWFPNENIPGLPIDNLSIEAGT